jgi:predicted RND superfamily exporter protein
MIGLIGNLRMGLISMIPNLAPVIFAIGLMGWIGMPLDMFSLMTGTIVIGLAVDDTIHFMHNFRREFEKTGDVDGAVEHTLRGTGQALLFTSLVLSSSFLVYTQAYMVHLFNFGLVTAAAIAVAFLADITLAPALVKLAARRA